MKMERITFSLAISLFVALASGCGQKDLKAASESEDAKTTLSSTVDDAKQAAGQAAREVKQAAESVATGAAAAATNAVEGVKAEAQSLIDKTKTFLSETRYEDALASLKQLSNVSLTPEQQKTVNDLKAQLEKLMSSQIVTNAASALNNILKK
jgi:prophage DNA circulation protein